MNKRQHVSAIYRRKLILNKLLIQFLGQLLSRLEQCSLSFLGWFQFCKNHVFHIHRAYRSLPYAPILKSECNIFHTSEGLPPATAPKGKMEIHLQFGSKCSYFWKSNRQFPDPLYCHECRFLNSHPESNSWRRGCGNKSRSAKGN